MNSEGDNKIFKADSDLVAASGEKLIDSSKSYSTKSLNDLYERMTKSGQYSQEELDKVDAAKKEAQYALFKQIVSADNVKNNGASLNGAEAQIFQAAKTIYQVGSKYSKENDKVFEAYQGVEFKDMSDVLASDTASFAKNIKGATFNAERQADAIKNGDEYAQAKANAQRAQEKK